MDTVAQNSNNQNIKKPGISNKLFFSLVIILILLIIAVFFAPSVIENLQEDRMQPPIEDVDVADGAKFQTTITNTSVVNAGGYYDITYKVVIKNITDEKIKDLFVKNNLAQNFAPHTVQVLSKSASSNVSLNNSFNGVSNIDMLFGQNTLDAGEEASITVTMRLTPESGTINLEDLINRVSVGGVFDPGSASGSGSGDTGATVTGEGSGGTSTPPPSPETDLTPREFTFEIVDVETDQVIGTLTPGQVLDLKNLPTSNFTIRAVPNIGINGSVVFGLNDVPQYQTENGAPYSLSGGVGSDYYPWNYALGPQTLTATGYTERDGQGESIGGSSVGFTIIDSRSESEGGSGSDQTGEEAEINFDLTTGAGSGGSAGVTASATGNGQGVTTGPSVVGTTGATTASTAQATTSSGTTTQTTGTTTTNSTGSSTTSSGSGTVGGATSATLPSTALFDTNTSILITGIMLVISGVLMYRLGIFNALHTKLLHVVIENEKKLYGQGAEGNVENRLKDE